MLRDDYEKKTSDVEDDSFSQDYFGEIKTFYYSKELGAYNFDNLVLNFDPSEKNKYYLQIESNHPKSHYF